MLVVHDRAGKRLCGVFAGSGVKNGAVVCQGKVPLAEEGAEAVGRSRNLGR